MDEDGELIMNDEGDGPDIALVDEDGDSDGGDGGSAVATPTHPRSHVEFLQYATITSKHSLVCLQSSHMQAS